MIYSFSTRSQYGSRHMISEDDLKEMLTKHGFTIHVDSVQCKLDGCDWVAYRKVKLDTKFCLCNDAPPQLGILHYTHTRDGEVHHSNQIEIVNESDIGWFELKCYNISNDDIIDVNKYESALVKAWEACWIES